MTISGELTQRQLARRKLLRIGFPLLLACGGPLLLLDQILLHSTPGPGDFAFIPLFLVGGAVVYWLWTRSDGWWVVEFTCDETSFRYRRWGSAQAEARALSDVAKVLEWKSSGEPVRYEVTFRDGGVVALGLRMPNAKAAADWLDSHRQA